MIHGQLPASLAANWVNVEVLNFGNTGLQSTIPPEWLMDGAFPRLQILSLDINRGLKGRHRHYADSRVSPSASRHGALTAQLNTSQWELIRYCGDRNAARHGPWWQVAKSHRPSDQGHRPERLTACRLEPAIPPMDGPCHSPESRFQLPAAWGRLHRQDCFDFLGHAYCLQVMQTLCLSWQAPASDTHSSCMSANFSASELAKGDSGVLICHRKHS